MQKVSPGLVLAAAAALLAQPALSQSTLPFSPPVVNPMGGVLAFPAVFGAPTAVAAPSNSGFVGASYANPRGGVAGAGGDGDIVAGYTLGNPIDAVSVTAGIALTGVDPLGDAGSVSLSLSRMLRAGGNSATFLGATASNLLPWGVSKLRGPMYSVYLSHLVGLDLGGRELPLQFALGYGTDSVRSASGSGALSDGLFAGVGVGVTQNLSAGLSFNETQLNLGATYSIPQAGASVTLGVMDVTDNTSRQQVTVSVGFGF